MPSLRSRLLLFLMKHQHLFRFRLKREIIDWNNHASIIKFREQCEKSANRFGKIPTGIEVTPVSIDGISAEWILPTNATRDKIIFFVHGGGYVSGSCLDHRIHVSKFVKGSNFGALLYEYRLAPEHPFPAALDDSLAAYRWLLTQGFSSSQIVFVGDSAGGGLCLALLLALRDKKIPLPAAAVALSPWTDLKCTGESYKTNAKKCLSPEGTWSAFSKLYVSDNDPSLPYISPFYGDLRGLPPLFISVGSDEILRDDSIRFAEKAKKAGVNVTLKIGEGMFHCYPVCTPLFPEATEAMDEIGKFINKHLKNKNE